jgi:uncharacterized damage-inducible protein DinB
MLSQDVRLMANYNVWMNTKVLDAAMLRSDDELLLDRRAFFGSILGTLNHLIVADTLWLKRFATLEAQREVLAPVLALEMPTSLNQVMFTDIKALATHRKMLDQMIVDMAANMSESSLTEVLHYTNSAGVVSAKPFSSVLIHFFNHQTHHRGQVTTLLTQTGVDVGITDLITLIPNEV